LGVENLQALKKYVCTNTGTQGIKKSFGSPRLGIKQLGSRPRVIPSRVVSKL